MGSDWLQASVNSLLQGAGDAPAQPSPEPRRSRRTRPPARLSPEAIPRVRRRIRSPSGDPSGQGAARPAASRRSRPGRNPASRRGLQQREVSASLPSRSTQEETRTASAGAQEPASPARRRGEGARRSQAGVSQRGSRSRQQSAAPPPSIEENRSCPPARDWSSELSVSSQQTQPHPPMMTTSGQPGLALPQPVSTSCQQMLGFPGQAIPPGQQVLGLPPYGLPPGQQVLGLQSHGSPPGQQAPGQQVLGLQPHGLPPGQQVLGLPPYGSPPGQQVLGLPPYGLPPGQQVLGMQPHGLPPGQQVQGLPLPDMPPGQQELARLQDHVESDSLASSLLPQGRGGSARVESEDAGRRQEPGSSAAGLTAPRQPDGAFSEIGTCSRSQRSDLSNGVVGSAIRAARKLISGSLSGGTWSAYSQAWKVWEDWKLSVGGDMEDDGRLLMLVGHYWEAGWSVPKVNRFLAGLAFGFKVRGLKDVTKSFLVAQALKGWRRGWKVEDKRRPISYELLLSLGRQVDRVCTSIWEKRLFKLAFSLAFFAALRLGELVCTSRFKRDGLSRDSVDLYEDRIEILIRSSKTDQLGKGCRVVVFGVPGSAMCPVRCLREFGSVAGGANIPLLVHADGSSLSRFQFISIFKRCLERGGFSSADFGSHSFRIGAATEAARRGLSDEVVKRIGRWESGRFKSYVRIDRL
ncbi:uncharacterized protein LOC142301406 [Anomaloglossus baeobatrachus]|uniref:uncharacterized protein LOC142301406 n=2 Tax=Anomaloglossus baeobatrachus TaxID=238106 RepID=UPI003F4FDC4E